jgi:hypothetical protein
MVYKGDSERLNSVRYGLAGLAVRSGRIESPGAILAALAVDADAAGYLSNQAFTVTPPILVGIEGAFKRYID